MADPTMAEIYSAQHTADPYPLFRRIREIDPVYRDEQIGDDGAWTVTGYAEAMTALADSRLTAARPHWDSRRLDPDTDAGRVGAMDALRRQVVVAEPPDHTRLRAQLITPFKPRPVEEMHEQVETLAHRLLDRALARDEFDAMADFGFLLPAAGLGRILGIPREQDYLPWMLSLGLLIDDGPVSRQHQPKLLDGVQGFLEFFRGQVEQRRDDDRRQDLIQALADSYTGGGFTDPDELAANLAFLLTAGQISSAHQIGNSILHLLRHPELYERVAADPDLVEDLSPELMRYDASVQLTKRRVREPMELGGHELATGDELYVWIGAAHRDPARFPDPDRLDPERRDVAHLAFGRGLHYCLGARMGRLVHDVAVRAFVQRVPHARLSNPDADVERSIMPTFRGPYVLPVDARSAAHREPAVHGV